jgi:hypothetical protein
MPMEKTIEARIVEVVCYVVEDYLLSDRLWQGPCLIYICSPLSPWPPSMGIRIERVVSESVAGCHSPFPV